MGLGLGACLSIFVLRVRVTRGLNCIRDACHGIITRRTAGEEIRKLPKIIDEKSGRLKMYGVIRSNEDAAW